MNVYAVILFVGVAISPIVAQSTTVFNGTCPAVVPLTINETKYAGQWYEIKRNPNTLVSDNCANPIYTWLTNTTKYSVAYPKNTQRNYELRRQSFQPVAGRYDVYINNTKESADIPYTVLFTDYDQYSVVWGCKYTSTTNTSIQRLVLLSRKSTLNSTFTNAATAVLNGYKIPTSAWADVCKSASTTTLPSLAIIAIVMLVAKRAQ